MIFLKSAGLAILVSLLLVPFRSAQLGLDYSTFVGYVVFCFLAYFLPYMFQAQASRWAIVLGLLVGQTILFPHSLIDFAEGNLWFLPQLAFQTIGIFAGSLSRTLRGKKKFVPAALGLVLAGLMFFWGFDLWFHYITYGTFFGGVSNERVMNDIRGFDADGVLIDRETLNNRAVLLDFWHTRCGECFRSFPELQRFYEKMSDNGDVAIYAVNHRLEDEDDRVAFSTIEKRGYSFPVLLPASPNIVDEFDVKYYPTTIVLDKSGRIVYKGVLSGATEKVEELLKPPES